MLRDWCLSGTVAAGLFVASAMPVAAQVATETAWVEARSARFTVLSSAGGNSAAGVAHALEAFQSAFARLVPGARTEPLAPVTVLAFDDFESYEPYAPLFEGRPVRVAGSFIGSPRANYLVLILDEPEKAWPVVFHELTHLIVTQTLHRPPTWFNEGIAEFYSTFRLGASGAEAELGHVIPDHLVRLRRDAWIPLDVLLEVAPDSSLYNEGDKRSLFYAQSWALVHYLLESRLRSEQLFDFLARTSQGQAQATAFRASFGMAPNTMEEELQRYVQRANWEVQRYPVAGGGGRVAPVRTTSVDDATALAALAGFHLTLGRPGEASVLAQRSVGTRPTGDGWAVLAASSAEQHLLVEAVPFIQRSAASLPREPVSLLWLGVAALGVADAGAEAEMSRSAALAVAKSALELAVKTAPGYAEGWAVLAHAALSVGSEADLALRASRQARALAPSRLHYRLFEAQALMQRTDFVGARRVIEELFDSTLDPQLADKAGEVLARISALEAARTLPDSEVQRPAK